jgi:hypothetical protein
MDHLQIFNDFIFLLTENFFLCSTYALGKFNLYLYYL